jgi:short subunit dehydrogenase-like uncharacterized protein
MSVSGAIATSGLLETLLLTSLAKSAGRVCNSSTPWCCSRDACRAHTVFTPAEQLRSSMWFTRVMVATAQKLTTRSGVLQVVTAAFKVAAVAGRHESDCTTDGIVQAFDRLRTWLIYLYGLMT